MTIAHRSMRPLFPIFGTATGAKLAGAPFGWALVGSAVGLGAGLLPFALDIAPDPNSSPVLYFAIPAAMQAAFTTLVTLGAN